MEQTGDVLISIMADKSRSKMEIDAAFQTFCAKYELRLGDRGTGSSSRGVQVP